LTSDSTGDAAITSNFIAGDVRVNENPGVTVIKLLRHSHGGKK
jgi:hypothetical protein